MLVPTRSVSGSRSHEFGHPKAICVFSLSIGYIYLRALVRVYTVDLVFGKESPEMVLSGGRAA